MANFSLSDLIQPTPQINGGVSLATLGGQQPASFADRFDEATNFPKARADLNLTPQEQALYQRHLSNLNGPGGVDNPDGSRSSLYQAVQEHNGKFYSIPTVWNGQRLVEPYNNPRTGQMMDVPNAQALQNVGNAGWDTFPSYATPEEADARYEKMHDYMEKDTAQFFANRQRR